MSLSTWIIILNTSCFINEFSSIKIAYSISINHFSVSILPYFIIHDPHNFLWCQMLLEKKKKKVVLITKLFRSKFSLYITYYSSILFRYLYLFMGYSFNLLVAVYSIWVFLKPSILFVPLWGRIHQIWIYRSFL